MVVSGERAMVSIPGVLVGVMVAVALGATAYAMITRFQAEGDAAPPLGLVNEPTSCGARLTVAGAMPGMRWNDVSMRVDGPSTYTIQAQSITAENTTWRGSALDEPRLVMAGDEIELVMEQPTGDPYLMVFHDPGGAISARVPLAGVVADAELAEAREACHPIAQGPSGIFDPGFAYEDPDNDFLFTLGVDIPIPNETIRRGTYTSAPENGLVIPPGVGPIPVSGPIRFRSTGAGFTTIGVDLTSSSTTTLSAGQDVRILNVSVRSTSETVDVVAGRGIFANGASIAAQKTVDLRSPSTIQINGTRLTSVAETINARASATGAVYALGANALAQKSINLGLVGTPTRGAVLAEGARLTSVAETINVIATGPDAQLRLQDASLVAAIAINLQGSPIHVAGATIDDRNDAARATPSGTSILGAPAAGSVNYAG